MQFQRKNRLPLGLIFAVVFIFIVALVLGSTVVLSHAAFANYQKHLKLSTENTAKHTQKFLEDLKILANANIFRPVTFLSNAEPLVSKYAVWRTNDEDSDSSASIALFRKHPDHFKTEVGYQNFVQYSDFEKMNVEWISQLANYDHIDMNSSSRIKSQLDKVENLNGFERIELNSELPIIDFMDLVNQATIFAIKNAGLTKEEKKAALNRLHHVGQILIATPSLVAQMTAIVVLRREFYLSQRWGVTLNSELSNEMINRVKRIAWTWPGIVSLSETNSLPSEIKNYMKTELMLCGAAGAVPFLSMIGDLLEPQWPLEPSFVQELDSSRNQYKALASQCKAESNLVFLKVKKSKFDLFDWNFRNFPYVRRVVSANLLSVSLFSSMRLYEELGEQKHLEVTNE